MKEKLQTCCQYLKQVPVIGRFFHHGPRVSVIRMAGVIADSAHTKKNISYAKYAPLIDKAFSKADTAVVLLINSPGGAAGQSSLIASLIRRKAEDTGLPVYAFVEDVAASGGYWLACAADEIYAQEVSIVGSIGVISAGFGFQDLIARYGVERRVYASGEQKSFLDPFKPENESDVSRLKALQSDIHDAFIEWVRARRGEKLQGADADLFEGQFWSGAVAAGKGVIDGFAEVESFMREKYGKDIKLMVQAPEKKLLPSILPFANLSEDIAETVAARTLWARYGL